MKTLFRIILVTLFLTGVCFAAQTTVNTEGDTFGVAWDRQQDMNTELYEKTAIADTTDLFWDSTDTDGTFNEIELPTGVECKSVLIQVISSSGIITEDPIPFHYSSTGNETQDFTSHVDGLVINIKKDTGSIGYIRAIAGYKVAVLILD